MRLRLLLGVGLAAFSFTCLPAYADEFEVAVDNGYFSDGLGGFNARFSDLPGISGDAVFDVGDHLYIEAFGRRSFAEPESAADAEIDLGVGFGDIAIADTCLSVSGYVGRWQYGEDLAIGDTAVKLELACGDAHVVAEQLFGVTDTAVFGASYDFRFDGFSLTPSIAYIDAYDETNYGLSASYALTEQWRIDAVGVWQEGQDAYAGVRVAHTF